VAIGQTLLVWFLNTSGKRAQRVRAEVEQAQRIHEAVVTPSHLQQDGLEVLARTFPSAQIGGDLVDVVERGGGSGRSGGEVDIFVADVAGHGVGAGLVTGMVKSAIRTQLAHASPPELDALASRLNGVLCDLTRPEMFVTIACLRVRQSDSRGSIEEVEFLLAGHPPVLHWNSWERRFAWIENDSLPLGIQPDATFRSTTLPVTPGDIIMLFTDGLNETIGKDGKQLGLEPLAQIFTRAVANPATLEALHTAVISAVREFGPQNDDRSLVLVRIAPLETPGKPPII
jgi:serine phosphatase RsbU (regulator of sigma subunit)